MDTRERIARYLNGLEPGGSWENFTGEADDILAIVQDEHGPAVIDAYRAGGTRLPWLIKRVSELTDALELMVSCEEITERLHKDRGHPYYNAGLERARAILTADAKRDPFAPDQDWSLPRETQAEHDPAQDASSE